MFVYFILLTIVSLLVLLFETDETTTKSLAFVAVTGMIATLIVGLFG